MSNPNRQSLHYNPDIHAHAALDDATNATHTVSSNLYKFRPSAKSLCGQTVVIIGAGVSGLTAAYELASTTSATVIVLEAQSRTGGRCLSLRTGDTLNEDIDSRLHSEASPETQVVRFQRPAGDTEPYLNAGPGRIPSTHVLLLGYMKEFRVPLEVYVMHSDANLVQVENGPDRENPKNAVASRRLIYNSRGYLNELVRQNARLLLEDFNKRRGIQKPVTHAEVKALESLAEELGDLTSGGQYKVGAPEPGEDAAADGSDRAGYSVLPGVMPGTVTAKFGLYDMLHSQFWHDVNMFQQDDALWQPTLLHPVGGMDNVEKAFATAAVAAGATIHLNAAVTAVARGTAAKNGGKRYKVTAGNGMTFEADYVLCNLAMPFLEGVLDDGLKSGLEADFVAGLEAVWKTQENEEENNRFLAPTTKIGWQAPRKLWQQQAPSEREEEEKGEQESTTTNDGAPVRKTQVGVTPIFGGISWTDHPITQIWYPSTGYHDRLGVLTGAYNFGNTAAHFGRMPISRRLRVGRAGAAKFGKRFAKGLKHGVAIAWQNMRHIKGGWAQWHNVQNSVDHFNAIQQGSCVDGESGASFFVVGDQVSSLSGWQEGAVAAALNAVSRMAKPDVKLPYLKTLADTRLTVQGFAKDDHMMQAGGMDEGIAEDEL